MTQIAGVISAEDAEKLNRYRSLALKANFLEEILSSPHNFVFCLSILKTAAKQVFVMFSIEQH